MIIAKTIQEVRIFLSVIEEDADDILHQLSLRAEKNPPCEDDSVFILRLEEDAEEIKKAVKAIKDHIDTLSSISF